MIQLKGNLELKSEKSQIRLYTDEGKAICAIQGWPYPLSPWQFNKFKLPKEIQHLPIDLIYNGRKLGRLHHGKVKITNFLTALIALIAYWRS